jgi:hypothetical protein
MVTIEKDKIIRRIKNELLVIEACGTDGNSA